MSLINFCVQQYFPFTSRWNVHIGICITYSPPQVRVWTHGHDHILTPPRPQEVTDSLENFYSVLFEQHNTVVNEQFQKVANPLFDLIYDIRLTRTHMTHIHSPPINVHRSLGTHNHHHHHHTWYITYWQPFYIQDIIYNFIYQRINNLLHTFFLYFSWWHNTHSTWTLLTHINFSTNLSSFYTFNIYCESQI